MHIVSPLLLVDPSPSSGAPDDRVGRFRGIFFIGRFRDNVGWLASDIVGRFKNWLVMGVLGDSVGLSSFFGATAFLTFFLEVGRSKVGFLLLMVVAAGSRFLVSIGWFSSGWFGLKTVSKY